MINYESEIHDSTIKHWFYFIGDHLKLLVQQSFQQDFIYLFIIIW